MPQNDSHSFLILQFNLPILKPIFSPAAPSAPAARSAGESHVQHDEPDQPDEPQTHTSRRHRQTSGEELSFLSTSFFTSFSSLSRRARSQCWSPAWPPPLTTTSRPRTARRTSSSSTSPWTSATPPPHPCRRCKHILYLQIFFLQVKIFLLYSIIFTC